MKLGQNVCLDVMKSRTSSKMGHLGSKTGSLDEMIEKPCVHSRGQSFSPIIMTLCQSVCLDKSSDEFINWSCRVKNEVIK